jgi:glycosyltransferase involved in cell wall biosynthesis
MAKNINQPIVTVLMPVYNGEKYLKEAIGSILGQSYKNFELLIIDDGSTDKSPRIISEYQGKDKRIRVITHKKNNGLVVSLNEGIENSKGEYIARMDADDISLPDRISKQVSFMENNTDCVVCGTWATAIDEEGEYLFDMKSPIGLVLRCNYWKPSPLIHPSVLFRKSTIKNKQYSSDFPRAEDYELWLRIGKSREKILNIPKYLLKYRFNNIGVSKSNQKEQKESSWNAFNHTFNTDIALTQYLSLTCANFGISSITRLKLLWKFRKKIGYPLWFMLIDNLYYGIRRLVYAINPNLNLYK